MSIVNQMGEAVGRDIDRPAMRVREAMCRLTVEEMRSLSIHLFKTAGIDMTRIALAMRCSQPTARRDAKVPFPDLRAILTCDWEGDEAGPPRMTN